MPPKTIVCCICGKEISKRKSLQIEGGRACRSHQEVIDAVESHRKELEGIESLRKVNEMMQVMALTSQVRLLIKYGAPVHFLMDRIERMFGHSVVTKVRQEVKEKGPVSDEEIQDSLMIYLQAKMQADSHCEVRRDLAKGMEKLEGP